MLTDDIMWKSFAVRPGFLINDAAAPHTHVGRREGVNRCESVQKARVSTSTVVYDPRELIHDKAVDHVNLDC